MKFSVMFTRFPGNNSDHPDTTDWLVETVMKAKADPRISDVFRWRKTDTPIPMVRNQAVLQAKRAGADYLVMIDNDMKVDAFLKSNPHRMGEDANAKPFWDSTLDWMLAHRDVPGVVGAPYCGPPPIENVYVFYWRHQQENHPEVDMILSQYAREEVANRSGIEEVGALPTGLVMIDMRVFNYLEPAWFYYEWTDKYESEKASTEDVTFTRDLSLQGMPCWCNWDSWAGHWKPKCVGRPTVMHIETVRQKFRDAVVLNMKADEKLVTVDGMADPQVRQLIQRRKRERELAANSKAEPKIPEPSGPFESVERETGLSELMYGLHAKQMRSAEETLPQNVTVQDGLPGGIAADSFPVQEAQGFPKMTEDDHERADNAFQRWQRTAVANHAGKGS